MTVEELNKIKRVKDAQKTKTKNKEFKNLSSKEKDELLETLCKIFNLIKE